jgi:hypothetical protein
MPKNKLNTPEQQADIITSLARGEPHQSIATRHEVSRPSISKIKKREEEAILVMRERIFSENFEKIADTIQDSIDLSRSLTKEFKENDKSITASKVTLKLGIDKTISNPLLARHGIHNSPVINQLNIDNSTNNNINVDPRVLSMISAGFGQDIEPMDMNEIEEAEILEVE